MTVKANEAKELFRQLTEDFFEGYTVIFANQSRIAKPAIPLVTIRPGNVRRPQAANNEVNDDGNVIGYYLSTIPMTIDLFSNGTAIEDDDGNVVAYENTAIDEMTSYADYMNSPKGVSWCHKNDVSILITGEAQDLTGVVNDNNYEYRARLEVLFSFTHNTDAETGNTGYFETAVVEEET